MDFLRVKKEEVPSQIKIIGFCSLSQFSRPCQKNGFPYFVDMDVSFFLLSREVRGISVLYYRIRKGGKEG
jgi:hypothetical protein